DVLPHENPAWLRRRRLGISPRNREMFRSAALPTIRRYDRHRGCVVIGRRWPMRDREKLEALLTKRFPGSKDDQIAAAANAIMGLDDDWEEVPTRHSSPPT